MEAVLRQLTNILELLAVSQTDRVREWDRHTALRAFQWAEYCEQLHSRVQCNPAVRSALESGLSDTNQRLQQALPSYSPVMFSELAQCQHMLLIHLLRNPSAPNSVIRMLFAEQESPFDQNSLIRCKSAFNLLCRTPDRTSYAGLQVEAVVRGTLLGKLLSSVLSRSGNDAYARTLLDSILHDSAGNPESLHDVIAAALLSPDDETSSVVQRRVLAWLQEHEGCLRKLCQSLSPGLCTVISRQSSEFKQAYWGVLKQWASCLEFDVLESLWVPTSDEPVTFIILTDRFKDLFNSGPPLKEETETELKTLKREAGDFNNWEKHRRKNNPLLQSPGRQGATVLFTPSAVCFI
ncbi:Fanconi anemia group F protein [Sinocyclocheilus anshuiensis]|uniref:FA complementation group F n=1 Tax=Sinocyclocheilus anshuiensis TaxID=1608454 RepID=A0A671LP19_9TELE|nr:PREDICTED: Fanconi anemia group F protein [Sinocyclocheilus anshuiensis]